MDTAAMLLTMRALGLILAETDAVAAALARLADAHRDTPIAARTLLQQALPTTFGLKAAGWLVSVLEARRLLLEVRTTKLAAQLGGAAGTLASLGDSGTEVLKEFARELELAEPVVPWHTDRSRIAEIGVRSLLAGALGKISLDIILMAQTEVGEVSEPAGAGRGGSSTLPHKRNPILSVTAVASVRRVQNLALTLQSAMVQEHERAVGAWHSEWEALSDALALTGGAVAAVREATEGLEVHPEKMRENLDATGGLLLAEHVTTLVAEHFGRLKAHDLVEAASLAHIGEWEVSARGVTRRSGARGSPLRRGHRRHTRPCGLSRFGRSIRRPGLGPLPQGGAEMTTGSTVEVQQAILDHLRVPAANSAFAQRVLADNDQHPDEKGKH